MPARLFPYAFLPLLGAVCISASPSQDLRYYQDLIPEPSSEDIALQYLTRLLKARSQNGGYGQVFFPPHHLDEITANRQRREQMRLQEYPGIPREMFNHPLSKKSNIFQGLNKPGLLNFLNPSGRIYTPSHYNDLLSGSQPLLQNLEYLNHHSWTPHRKPVASEDGMKEEPSVDIDHRFLSKHQNSGQRSFYEKQISDITEEKKQPDFTFEMHKPSSREKDHRIPFSEPGDREFDIDEEFPTRFTEAGTGAGVVSEERTERISQVDDADVKTNPNNHEEFSNQMKPAFYSLPKPKEILNENNDDIDDDEEQEGEDDFVEGSAERSPVLHRRAESPIVTSVDHGIGKDIYFVAVVAGCSAAAMFILVLISLTWCRFQRGAKAAADVEYPAYGVTGPNKDTSPSGDRRLAQSAQMYHYQHQKQQIIAMESRTATGRDPGSVSEAESDEENEEGDYTVYECPGLAPTGEMEVKNPLFHDDPTPATPAGPGQSSRSSEDQNI